MAYVVLLTSQYQGVIVNTPSGQAYAISAPGLPVAVDSRDQSLLMQQYGFTAAPESPGGFGNLTAVLLTASSGNFIAPPGVLWVAGTAVGGGGGGGGVSAATATGSGGASGVIIEFVMAITSGQVVPYTCGAGGTRGANTGGNGGDGGDTTFGPFTAKGGPHGNGSTSGNAAAVTAAVEYTGILSASTIIPTAAAFLTTVPSVRNPFAGAAGTGGLAGPCFGLAGTPGTNGSATDSTGYGTGGSGAGSTLNTAGTGGLGAPGAVFLRY